MRHRLLVCPSHDRPRCFWLALVAWAFGAYACTYPRTQVLLEIEGDSTILREATEVTVHVETARGITDLRLLRADAEARGESFLPIRIPIASRDGRGSYVIRLEGRKVEVAGATTLTTRLAENRARSTFAVGRISRLPLWLLTGCDCSEQQRCVPGPGMVPRCEELDAALLPQAPDAGSADADAAVSQGCQLGYHLCGATCLPDGDVASCGTRCSACPTVEGGVAVCQQAACAVRCNGTRQMCGVACLDTTNNPAHCGACGRACGGVQICVGSACVDPPQCSNTSPSSCPQGSYCDDSRCLQGCDEPSDCSGGATCNLAAHTCDCPTGTMRCGGVCAACPSNAASTACDAQNQCVAASCTAPQILCGGACTTESVAACGASCTRCSTTDGVPACVNGSCGIASCNDGYRSCGGVCALCPSAASTSCDGTRCVASSCAQGLAFCQGQCVAESASQCGASCSECQFSNGSAACTAGSCMLSGCNTGYLACAGRCAVCPSNATGTSCNASAACVATSCAAGFARCDNQCVAESASQCGSGCLTCTISNGTPACVAGACALASCNAGFVPNATQSACVCNAPSRVCNSICATCPSDVNATGTTCSGNACILSGCVSGYSRNASNAACVADPPSLLFTLQVPRSLTAGLVGENNMGDCVALSPDGLTLVTGSELLGSPQNGGVLTFRRSTANGNFGTTPSQDLTPPSGSAAFGIAVAVSPNGLMLAVGDYEYGTPSLGALHLFTRTSATASFGTTPTQTLARPTNSGSMGSAVAFSPDGLALAVGDFDFGASQPGPGAVHVFTRTTQSSNFAASPSHSLVGPSGSTSFGGAVAFGHDGLTLAIGDHEIGPSQQGAVYFFVRASPSANFAATPNRTFAVPSNSRNFGGALAFSADGLWFAIGDWDFGTMQLGAVHVFARASVGDAFGAAPSQTLTGPNGSDHFGTGVAFNSDARQLLVSDSAYYISGSNDGAGAVWMFTR